MYAFTVPVIYFIFYSHVDINNVQHCELLYIFIGYNVIQELLLLPYGTKSV